MADSPTCLPVAVVNGAESHRVQRAPSCASSRQECEARPDRFLHPDVDATALARTTGADIILNLLADVAELKENSIATTQHLEDLEASVAKHLDGLVKISRDSTRRLERTAVTPGRLADLFKDHEARISALESRE